MPEVVDTQLATIGYLVADYVGVARAHAKDGTVRVQQHVVAHVPVVAVALEAGPGVGAIDVLCGEWAALDGAAAPLVSGMPHGEVADGHPVGGGRAGYPVASDRYLNGLVPGVGAEDYVLACIHFELPRPPDTYPPTQQLLVGVDNVAADPRASPIARSP